MRLLDRSDPKQKLAKLFFVLGKFKGFANSFPRSSTITGILKTPAESIAKKIPDTVGTPPRIGSPAFVPPH
jgi:hypothetical protein